jgi:hypothetical protein
MRSYTDITFHEEPDGESDIEPRTDWLEPAPDTFAEAAESDLGDSGAFRPWKTSDI